MLWRSPAACLCSGETRCGLKPAACSLERVDGRGLRNEPLGRADEGGVCAFGGHHEAEPVKRRKCHWCLWSSTPPPHPRPCRVPCAATGSRPAPGAGSARRGDLGRLSPHRQCGGDREPGSGSASPRGAQALLGRAPRGARCLPSPGSGTTAHPHSLFSLCLLRPSRQGLCFFILNFYHSYFL